MARKKWTTKITDLKLGYLIEEKYFYLIPKGLLKKAPTHYYIRKEGDCKEHFPIEDGTYFDMSKNVIVELFSISEDMEV